MSTFVVNNRTDLDRACSMVRPGDVIEVVPGLYAGERPATLTGKGEMGRPIVIRAARKEWISGGRRPDPGWGGGSKIGPGWLLNDATPIAVRSVPGSREGRPSA